jgi:hypothetical protein
VKAGLHFTFSLGAPKDYGWQASAAPGIRGVSILAAHMIFVTDSIATTVAKSFIGLWQSFCKKASVILPSFE